MTTVEIILIIIGVVFLIGSFFITEKLSQKDIEQITLMSEADLKHIAEKQVNEVKNQVENSVEEIIEDSLETTKRGLEKETNNKIMAVSEYSDTVMETMNKTHNEIMFLYSMLNDKQTETAEMVSDLQRYAKQIREFNMEEALEKMETAANVIVTKPEKEIAQPVAEENVKEEGVEVEQKETVAPNLLNKNEQILLLYKEGKDEVQIAKELGCGLGEVRLVVGLYNEA